MNKFVVALVAILAAVGGFFLFQQLKGELPQPNHALYYKQARTVKPFQLTDQQGSHFTNEQLKNKWSLVFFGYTSCPDVCPTTLQSLNFIYDELTAIANTQVLLVSVDPQRDSQEKLAKYIAYFNKNFIALRAEHDVLFPFARNMGLMYAITDNKNMPENAYLVDHSASIVLINPDGKIAAIFKPEQAVGEIPTVDTEKLLSDYQKIVALYK